MKPTASEKRYHLFVMSRGCCVCGGEAVFHHEKQVYPLPRRDHMFGVPLCHQHHSELHSDWNIDRFYDKYGVNLTELAGELRDEYGGN